MKYAGTTDPAITKTRVKIPEELGRLKEGA